MPKAIKVTAIVLDVLVLAIMAVLWGAFGVFEGLSMGDGPIRVERRYGILSSITVTTHYQSSRQGLSLGGRGWSPPELPRRLGQHPRFRDVGDQEFIYAVTDNDVTVVRATRDVVVINYESLWIDIALSLGILAVAGCFTYWAFRRGSAPLLSGGRPRTFTP